MTQLTPSQQAAVLYLDGDSSILAGAGSGKTFVLVEKVALLVEKLHLPLEKILVVAFTEKAAGEIKERIARRLRMPIRDLDPLPVGTIHAMAADLLRRFGGALEDLPNQHRRCVEGEAPTALPVEGATRAPMIDFRIMDDFLAGLERLKSTRERFLELIEERNRDAIAAVEHLGLHKGIRLFLDFLSRTGREETPLPYPAAFSEILARYRSRKAALGMLDFDDLETELVRLLSDRRQCSAVQDSCNWIVVDEFQDVSPIQWKILSLLHNPPKSRLVIVGDPRQSIYRFRGADPSLFRRVSREIKQRGGGVFDLSENFRSTAAVINFVNGLSSRLFTDNFPPLRAHRQEADGAVEFLNLDAKGLSEIRKAEAAAVAAHLQALRDQGILWRSMALLFRTRRAVSFYEEAFREAKIPYITSLGEPLLERPEVISLIFLMRKLCGLSGAEEGIVTTGLQYSKLASFNETIPLDPLPAFLDTLFEKTTHMLPESVHLNLKAFRDLLSNLTSLGLNHLKALLENLRALREEEARITCPPAGTNDDAVSLMTVHASKGLEFPVVVLCDLTARINSKGRGLYVESDKGELVMKEKDADATGLKDRLVKGERYTDVENKNEAEEIEESKRLLYVAMTRAKDRLVLPLPVSLEKRTKKKESAASWSEWLKT